MDFLDQMALGRDNAKRDRDRGGSSVKVYRSAVARARARGGDARRGTWQRAVDEAASHWRSVRDQALADFDHAVNGSEWEGLEL